MRKARNRQALLRAATKLFAEAGYDNTTVEQIAAAAGVSPRTVFYHFATKEEILFDGYAERLDEAIRRFRTADRKSLYRALADTAQAIATALADQRDVFVTRARFYRTVPTLRATMLAINEEWIDKMTAEVAERLELDPITDVRPRLATAVLNAANRAAIETWLAGGAEADITQVFADSVAFIRPAVDRIERSVRAAAERPEAGSGR